MKKLNRRLKLAIRRPKNKEKGKFRRFLMKKEQEITKLERHLQGLMGKSKCMFYTAAFLPPVLSNELIAEVINPSAR